MKTPFNRWLIEREKMGHPIPEESQDIAIKAWNAAIGKCKEKISYHHNIDRWTQRDIMNDLKGLKYK